MQAHQKINDLYNSFKQFLEQPIKKEQIGYIYALIAIILVTIAINVTIIVKRISG